MSLHIKHCIISYVSVKRKKNETNFLEETIFPLNIFFPKNSFASLSCVFTKKEMYSIANLEAKKKIED